MIDVGLLLSVFEEAGLRCAFDREIVYLEHACKAELGEAGGGPRLVEDPPKPGTATKGEPPSWFAKEILATISQVRVHIEDNDASKAAVAAMEVERLVDQLDAQYDSKTVRTWRKAQEQHRVKVAERQRILLDTVCDLRSEHSGQYESANAAATWLIDNEPEAWGYKLEGDEGAIQRLMNEGYDEDAAEREARRRAVHALAVRIRRAEKK